MKAYQLLILVRQRLGDMQKISFSDVELIIALNNAIDRLCGELASKANPEILQTMVIEGQERTERPTNFIAFRGQYPIEFEQGKDGKIYAYHINPDFDGVLNAKYFAIRPHIETLDDEIPFDQSGFQKTLVMYTLYDIKPSMEGGTNDSQGTDGQGGTA